MRISSQTYPMKDTDVIIQQNADNILLKEIALDSHNFVLLQFNTMKEVFIAFPILKSVTPLAGEVIRSKVYHNHLLLQKEAKAREEVNAHLVSTPKIRKKVVPKPPSTLTPGIKRGRGRPRKDAA